MLRPHFVVFADRRTDRQLDLKFERSDVLAHDPRFLLRLQTPRGRHLDGAAQLTHGIQSATGQLQLELAGQAPDGAVQILMSRLGRDGVLLDQRIQATDVVGEAFQKNYALLRGRAQLSCHVRKIAENRILATQLVEEAVVSRVLAYTPAVVWAALLLILGGRSDVPTVDTPLPLDKAAHFLLYGALGMLTTWGWRRADRRPHLLLPLVLAVAVGAADELHQRMVARRSSDVVDWLADTAGIITGCWMVLRMAKEAGNAD